MKDSDPEKWEYREHTRVKHILLGKYLKVWITALGKYNTTIGYFDGFAGRGEYTDGTLGSPIIALKLADDLSGHFNKLICFFIEKDQDNFKNLEEILKREAPSIKNWSKIEIKRENDEFTNVIEEIFTNIQKGHVLIPSFFFVDPFGFSGIPFNIIIRILSNPKTEVFFTFMVRDIARFIQLPELEETFNSMFGTPLWKNILVSSQKPEIALINLYRQQLHEIAKVKYSWAFRVCTSEKVQTLYYLIHATNNFKGHSIMKDIMFKQSAQGDFAYLGPQDVTARIQMKLFDINSTEELKKYLLTRFEGKTISYAGIQEEICTPWYSEPPYVNTHYNQALKFLELEGKITVNRITSKTSRGLGGEDIITFPITNQANINVSPSANQKTGKIKIHYKEYRQLDGYKEIMVERVNDNSIISRFDKTPLPIRSTDVICPHFIELKWAYGCPFDCAWCYLKGTFRFHPTKTKPVIKDYTKVELHTRRFLEQVTTPEILNTGEIADSLMAEGTDQPFSKFIIPMFEGQNKHKVLFVTKSDNIKNLLEINPHNQVIISFSLNAGDVASRWEKGAPPVERRIEAGRKLSEAGYEVRVRIDPMVPVENWETHYIELIEQIFRSFTPSRITLGSLRGLQTTVNGSTDRSWVEYLKEKSNWGKKIEFKIRYNMYTVVINHLKERYNYDAVALCKETLAMWGRLGMDYKKIKCNCIW
jgi:spore photoproduct lyase